VTRPERLGEAVVRRWLAEHGSWRLDGGHLVREIATKDYASAITIAQGQIDIAERLDHHPLLSIGYRSLRVEVWTHDRDALTQLDLEYAQSFDALVTARFGDVVVAR